MSNPSLTAQGFVAKWRRQRRGAATADASLGIMVEWAI